MYIYELSRHEQYCYVKKQNDDVQWERLIRARVRPVAWCLSLQCVAIVAIRARNSPLSFIYRANSLILKHLHWHRHCYSTRHANILRVPYVAGGRGEPIHAAFYEMTNGSHINTNCSCIRNIGSHQNLYL